MADTQALQAQLASVRNTLRQYAAMGKVTPEASSQIEAALRIAFDQSRTMAGADITGSAGRADVMRPLPSRILRPSGIAAVAASGTSNAYPVQWPATGMCTGFTCGTIDNTLASLGAMSARVTIQGSKDIASDGQAGQYMHFASTFSNPDGQQQWWPCMIPFTQGDQWQVYFRNESSSAGPFTPVISFQYVPTVQ